MYLSWLWKFLPFCLLGITVCVIYVITRYLLSCLWWSIMKSCFVKFPIFPGYFSLSEFQSNLPFLVIYQIHNSQIQIWFFSFSLPLDIANSWITRLLFSNHFLTSSTSFSVLMRIRSGIEDHLVFSSTFWQMMSARKNKNLWDLTTLGRARFTANVRQLKPHIVTKVCLF